MPADIVGPEQRRDGGEEHLGTALPQGLAGDDHPAGLAQDGAELLQLGGGELVKDQIARNHGVVGITAEGQQVGLMPGPVGGPGGRPGPEVESVGHDAAGRQLESEFTRAGAELQHPAGRAVRAGQHVGQPAVIAHHPVDQPQVAPVVQRVGMVRGQ